MNRTPLAFPGFLWIAAALVPGRKSPVESLPLSLPSVLAALTLYAAACLPSPALAQEDASRGIVTVEKSAPAEAEESAGSKQLISGKYRALIIGNNTYRGTKWPPLKTAAKDAEELAALLRTRYGFAEKDVMLKLNSTRRDMVRAFMALAEVTQEEDHVLIYYAGHGEYDELNRGYWIPVDAEDSADYVSNDEILGFIRSNKSKHKLLISDSCFSGNMLTRAAKDVPSDRLLPSRYVIEKTKLVSAQGFSSGGNEPVSDGGSRWNGHSIFAYHLIAQLNANQQPYLSAQFLGFRVGELVANDTSSALGSGQTPVFSPIANMGHQGGDFFFYAGGNLGKPALVMIVMEGSTVFGMAGNGARKVVLHHLRENLQSLGIPSPEEAVDLVAASPESVLKALRQKEADRALLARVRGTIARERSNLWEGLSSVEMELDAFRIQDGKLVPVGQLKIKPQTFPMREWSEDRAKLESQFEKNAEKLVNRSAQGELTTFLDNLRE